MKIVPQKKGQDGIAIFIVLVSILVLAAMAGIFAYNMRVEMKLAANSASESDMEWIGKSGLEYAKWYKVMEEGVPGCPAQRFDALNQRWAGGPGCTNDSGGVSDGLTDVPCGDGKFTVKMIDTERKLNINNFANNESIMTEALTAIGVDAADQPTIISSIQDWIDRDSETHVNGAESDYYQTLSPPYYAKNGPIDDISELLLVKGVTSEIFWGPNATNHPAGMFQPRPANLNSGLLPNSSANTSGLNDIFTAISSGRVNINTCPPAVFRALGMDEATAQRIVSLRAGPDGVDGTDDDVPFNNPGEIVNAGLPPQLVQQFLPYLTIRSTTYEVRVDVDIGQSHRTYVGLMVRTGAKDFQIVSMHWE